jgi:hypothetical protein
LVSEVVQRNPTLSAVSVDGVICTSRSSKEVLMSMVKIGIPLHVFPGEMDPLLKLFNRIDQTDLPQEDKDELMLLIDEFKDQMLCWRA